MQKIIIPYTMSNVTNAYETRWNITESTNAYKHILNFWPHVAQNCRSINNTSKSIPTIIT